MNARVSIVHEVPGRLRLKLGRLKHNEGLAEKLRSGLRGCFGVHEAEVNSSTGNVVIHFERNLSRPLEFYLSVAQALEISPMDLDGHQSHNHNGNGAEPAATAPASRPGASEEQRRSKTNGGRRVTAELVHRVNGRCRLRVPALRWNASLAERLQEFLSDLPNVKEVSVGQTSGSVVVAYKSSSSTAESLCEALAKTTLQDMLTYQRRTGAVAPSTTAEETSGNEMWYSTVGMAVALAAEPLFPLVPVLLFASALPMLKRAYRSLSEDGKLNVDCLDASATALLVAQGTFPMALGMVWLINLADYIRDLTVMQSQKAIEEVLAYQRYKAWVLRDGKLVRVPVSEIAPHETIVVHPGERIPVDGTVLSGKALVDQAALTGESFPVEKIEGSTVFAATVVREGEFSVRADRIGDDTEAARIVRLVQEAPARETKIQNYAVKWANALVPYSFVGGAVGAVFGGGLQGAAAVLIVDYGTGIRIAAPTTVLSAMTKAIRNGILIKGGRHLEDLAEVDAVVFDKTGTLTTGHPDVLDVIAFGSHTTDDVLVLAAAAELRLTHPVAEAIVRTARDRGLTIPERTSSDYTLGLGVEAVVDGSTVLVGNARFLVEKAVALTTEVEEAIREIQSRVISPICIAKDGVVVGLLSVADPLRPEAREVVQALRDRGVKKIIMLTGDHKDVARRVAAELGITDYVAEVFPGDKSEAVMRLQQEGFKVAVVGDGINDSPALAYADVGIAVDGGTEVARETAPVVLLHGGLWKVPLAIDIGRETVALIRQNWKIISIPNTFALAFACIGLLGPIGSVLLSNGSAIIATMNALRPIMQREGKPPIKVVSPRPEPVGLLPAPLEDAAESSL